MLIVKKPIAQEEHQKVLLESDIKDEKCKKKKKTLKWFIIASLYLYIVNLT